MIRWASICGRRCKVTNCKRAEYQRLLPGAAGEFVSQVLGLELRLENDRLRVFNPATGERLLTPAEALVARRTEAAARRTEAEARQAEAAARHADEAELERLRAELARLRGKPEASQG